MADHACTTLPPNHKRSPIQSLHHSLLSLYPIHFTHTHFFFFKKKKSWWFSKEWLNALFSRLLNSTKLHTLSTPPLSNSMDTTRLWWSHLSFSARAFVVVYKAKGLQLHSPFFFVIWKSVVWGPLWWTQLPMVAYCVLILQCIACIKVLSFFQFFHFCCS